MIFRRSHFAEAQPHAPAVPPCNAETGFGPATLIDTTDGPVPVEWITPSHSVITRDHGPQPVLKLWRGYGEARQMVRLPAGCLGTDTPSDDLVLRDRQPLALSGPVLELHFGLPELLCSAGQLMRCGIGQRVEMPGLVAPVYHLLMRRQELVRSADAWLATTRIDTAGAEGVPPDLEPALLEVLDLHAAHQRSVRPWLEDWEVTLAARLVGATPEADPMPDARIA